MRQCRKLEVLNHLQNEVERETVSCAFQKFPSAASQRCLAAKWMFSAAKRILEKIKKSCPLFASQFDYIG